MRVSSRQWGVLFLPAICLALIRISPGFAEEGAVSRLPLVSIQAILERDSISVGDVRWAGNEKLVGDFSTDEREQPRSRLLDLAGVFEAALGQGSLAAYAPDGAAVLRYTENGWALRDVSTGKETAIGEPAGETRKFHHVYPPIWSRDGRFAAIVEPYTPSSAIKSIGRMDGVRVIDMDDQRSPLETWITRLTIVDRDNPTAPRRIVLQDVARQLDWGKNQTLYVVQVQISDEEPSTIIYSLTPDSNAPEEIYRTRGRIQNMRPAVNPGGKLIAVAVDVDNRNWNDFVSLVLIDAESGREVRRLTDDLPITGDDYSWSADGAEIYARVRHGGLDEIWAIPLDGEPYPLSRGHRRHFDLGLSPDGGKLSYQTEDGYGHKDIRVLDLESNEEEVVLVLDEPAKDFRLGGWRQIEWQSSNGVRPYGYLITPPDFDPNRRYPMLVDVHGGGPGSRLFLHGPFTLGTAKGPLEWHAWAAMGYVVFVPDYRSTGDYGPEVIAARYKNGELSPVDDIKDIISGVRYVIDQGSVDPTRVAILGHSAGSARVYLILTRYSELFAAAILNEGIAPDPVSLVIGLSSGEYAGAFPVGIFRSALNADLAEAPERYKTNYMFDAYRIKAPTLILMGNEQKGGVDHMPYEVLYSILKKNGVPTRFLSFVDEGHNYKAPAAARLAFEEAQRWLEAHMAAQPE